ncbi:MAG: hypothetical protein LKJ90_00285 [Faecalibacterium sp.]|jgi:hypothetical protein|nr:hypothetical protein [Faecalibacterium sp.]
MKKTGKYLLRGAAFLLALLLCIQLAGWYIRPCSNRNFYAYDSGGIYGEDNNTIDVLVIGSSNASRDITPMEWYREYGIAGYTFGIDAGSVTEVFYALQKIYRTQTPKVVVLCADTIYNIPDGMTPMESALDDTIGVFFPLWRYHNNWRELRIKNLARHHDFTWRDYDKGFSPRTGCKGMDATWFMSDQGPAQAVPALRDAYVQAIRRMCKAHGSEMKMVTLPAKDWTMAKHLGMTAYAQKNGIPYVDYNLPDSGITIDWTQDTYDTGFHLNYVGAMKVTQHLGTLLAQSDALPDRRGAAGWAKWKKEYERYCQEQKEQLTAMQATVPQAAKYLAAA